MKTTNYTRNNFIRMGIPEEEEYRVPKRGLADFSFRDVRETFWNSFEG